MSAGVRIHRVARIVQTRKVFDTFNALCFVLTDERGEVFEIDVFSDVALEIEDGGTEEHRKKAA